MFRKDDIVEIIKEGNLDRLRKILRKDSNIVEKTFKWEAEGKFCAPVSNLHLAAFFNQPEIVKFLVTEKGMAVDKAGPENWTPLHYAAHPDAAQAVQALLALGADEGLKSSQSFTPYETCKEKDTAAQKLLRPAHEIRMKEEAATAAAKEEALRQESEAKIKGTWTAISSDEIMFERDLPGHRLHLTKTFNFATESRLLITESLEAGGQPFPPEEKLFSEIPDKEVKQARAQLDKANGVVPAETTPSSEASPAPPAAKRLIVRKEMRN